MTIQVSFLKNSQKHLRGYLNIINFEPDFLPLIILCFTKILFFIFDFFIKKFKASESNKNGTLKSCQLKIIIFTVTC